MTDNTNIEALRKEFETWLMNDHGLDSEWQSERNCYKDFAAHLAFKAWQASRAALSNAEPVAEVEMMPGTIGFTMACFHAKDVPIGTKLFLHPSVPAPQWLPIETAPKNEWVLVYYTNGMEVSIAIDDRSDGLWFDWDGDLYGEVSHWMPLPVPPLTNTGEQG